MLRIVFAVFQMQLSHALSEKVLVSGPETSESAYEEVLKERTDLKSPIEIAIENNKSGVVRSEVFQLVEDCLEQNKCHAIEDHFSEIRKKRPLNQKEFTALREFWIKAKKPVDCYWKAFDGNPACKLKKLNVTSIGLSKEDSYLIIVDGVTYKKGQEVQVLPQKKYHWQIISIKYLPKQAWGSIEEIENQISINVPYVTGGCLASTTHSSLNSETSDNMWVVFDQTCVKKAESAIKMTTRTEPQPSWFDENKKWAIPALALVVGSVYLFHDKQVEFYSPFK